MPAPSKSWVTIADSQVDADSPLDAVLMTGVRDDLVHLQEWLGFGFTAAQAHAHNGTDSALITTMASAAVAQAQLKTSMGSVSNAAAPAMFTLPGGEYGFYPQVKHASGTYPLISIAMAVDSTGAGVGVQEKNINITTSYVTTITLGHATFSGAGTQYAQQRYVQASPPYKIGTTLWGHFLFLLRRISDGVVVSAYEAQDPPWAYNGATHLPKDDLGRLSSVPHPFINYWSKDPGVDGLEIVMMDLTGHNTKKWIADNAAVGKGPLEDLSTLLAGTGGKGKTGRTMADLALPMITGFTDRINIVTP